MSHELSPEHQAIAEAARKRVLDYIEGLAVHGATQEPGELIEELPEAVL